MAKLPIGFELAVLFLTLLMFTNRIEYETEGSRLHAEAALRRTGTNTLKNQLME